MILLLYLVHPLFVQLDGLRVVNQTRVLIAKVALLGVRITFAASLRHTQFVLLHVLLLDSFIDYGVTSTPWLHVHAIYSINNFNLQKLTFLRSC